MRDSSFFFVLGALSLVIGIVGTSSPSSRKECGGSKGLSTSKLICYYSSLEEVDGCYCSHVILPANTDVQAVEGLKKRVKGVKVYVSVNEFNQGLIDLLKTTKIDGLELNLKKLDSKNDITDFISTIKTKIGSDLGIALAVPPKAELVAKYFDFKPLSKHVDLFILQTAFLGASSNVTFHPSRLSGMWDMQNTDSVVDLATGLGAPLSKLVITAPAQAFQFTLQNEDYTAPGSPALELSSMTRNELCKLMRSNGNWTLERDEDQAGPYIFSKEQWIAFDDSKSIDIKAKYSRVRGLAGIALKDLTQDGGAECGTTILEAAYNGLSRQARAPRQAVLHSLEREIVDSSSKPLDSVQLSPFRISRIIDTEGKIHVVRQDTRTEFQCSRQGYFVHPRSCNRFYRCVKFDQQTDDYNVFEFDCPAGLAFDERVEVCVWPGSLPHGTPCSGSSEIAPVPRERFECPSEPGYYPDPENCRWFFACLDHGKSGLTPYEFRCPFGLVFDGERLICEWPWLVPKCASGSGLGLSSEYYYGGANKGLQPTGLVLQNYDGLGPLGTIKLGGLGGTIEKPISTVYSNVGTTPLRPGYHNAGGYIVGSGLSYNAAQSLQNAGLLKINNGVVYQPTPSSVDFQSGGYQGGAQAVSSHQPVHQYYGEGGGQYQHAGYSGDAQGNSGYVYAGGAGGVGVNYEVNEAAKQDDAFSGVAGSINIIGGGYSAVGSLSGIDISHNGAGGVAGSTPSVLTVTETPAARVTPIPTVTAVPVPGIKTLAAFDTIRGGVIANIPELQYKVKTLEAAGLSNNVSTSYVNFVITAPSDGQQTYAQNGGYVYEKPVKTFTEDLTRVSTPRPFASVTSAQPENYVSSTPSTGYVYQKDIQDIPAPHGYVYNKPAVLVEQHPQFISTTSAPPAVSTAAYSQTYHYQPQSATVTEQQPASVPIYQQPQLLATYNYQPQKTPYTYHSVAQQAVYKQSVTPALVSSYFNIANSKAQSDNVAYQQNVGYSYPRPAVKFEDTPVVYSTAKPAVVNVDYTYQKPAGQYVQTYSTPRPTIVSSYFNLANNKATEEENVLAQKQQVGYSYPQPAVKFEETPRPVVVQEGYSYSKPSVQIVETPVTYSTPKPVAVHPTQQAVVSSYFNLANAKATSKNQLLQQSGGYIYSKPEINFEEAPVFTYSTPKPAIQVSTPRPIAGQEGYSYHKPAVQFVETPTPNPTVFSGYFNLANSKATAENVVEHQSVGYAYPKPVVQPIVTYSTAKPVVEVSTQRPVVVQENYIYQKPVVTYSTPKPFVQQVGYTYPKPAIKFEDTPVVTYSTPKPTTPKPVVVQEGYSYQKPAVQFVETPVTYSTPKPAVVSSYFNLVSSKAEAQNVAQQQHQQVGYSYPQPALKFEETPAVTYTTPRTFSSTVRPVVEAYHYDTPIAVEGHSYPRPAINFVEAPKPVVSSYFNLESSKANSAAAVEQNYVGYSYTTPKTVNPFLEIKQTPRPSYTYVTSTTPKPTVVSSYSYLPPSSPRPVIAEEYRPAQPAVVTSYYNVGHQEVKQPIVYSTPRPTVISEYSYSAPSTERTVVVEEQRPVQPAVVTSYYNIGQQEVKQPIVYSSTPKPAVVSEYSYLAPTTERTVVVEEPRPVKPAVVTSYYNLGRPEVKTPVVYSTPRPVDEYSYVAPITQKSVIVEEHKPVQPAVVTSYFNLGSTETPVEYSTPKPVVVEQPKPTVVTRYFHQQLSKGYDYPKPTVQFEEEPQPVREEAFVKKTAYVTGQYQQNHQESYSYDNQEDYKHFGQVVVENYQVPNYEKVRLNRVQYQQPQVVVDYVSTTPRPTYVSTLKTIATKKQQPVTPATVTIYDSRLTSTLAPEVISSTTRKPVSRYSFSSQYHDTYSTVEPTREYLPVTSTPRVVTTAYPKVVKVVENFVAPEMTTLARDYLPVKIRTKAPQVEVQVPSREYLPVPNREYLPSRRVKVTTTTAAPEITTLSREYLPVRARVKITSTTEEPTYTRRPQTIKVVRPVTVIKTNDAHPLLSAKLGAQCTCVSNKLTLRRKQKLILVEDTENDDDYDEYGSEDGNTLVENYEAQRVVDILPTTHRPDTYRKRVKVNPVTPATQIFYQKNTTPIAADDSTPSDREIVKAVRTGLKLVKQAAKEGAREGTQEALSGHQFDRYGPGGVRSRTETLQGTIDCQRAGLFRHPTQCNKFYSCRWDCTKKRFTLHVFNCPVHLTFDNSLGACNWPSQGPACVENTLITSD